MGFMAKVRATVLGHMNDLLDKAIDMNSIPVLKQYVRDLEDAIESARHQQNVATAQVTTLNRDLKLSQDNIAADERRASAYLSSSNEAAARQVATRIHDGQTTIATLKAQIEASKEQAAQLSVAVEKMKSKHDEILARVRQLEISDRSTKALEKSTAALKSSGAALNTGVDSNVDNLAHRIEERNDVAQQEFKDAVGDISTPEDPLKTAAVDDILAGLKSKMTVPA